MRAIRLVANRNIVLSLAILVGFLVGPGVRSLELVTLPALMIVMTLSTTQIPSRVFLESGKFVGATVIALAASYGGAGLVFIILSRPLMVSPELWAGFVLVGIIPPAIAVIPFVDILGGDTRLALLGVFGSYIVSLALVPVLSVFLLKGFFVHPIRVLMTLFLLVVVPLALSRMLMRIHLTQYIGRWRAPITNWCFFVVTVTAIGLNRDLMLREPLTLLRVFVVAAAGTFGVGTLLQYVLVRLEVKPHLRRALLLLATLKNGGLAIAIALSSFGENASYPAAIVIICSILYFLWLGRAGAEDRHQDSARRVPTS